jgi:hypothetical protein
MALDGTVKVPVFGPVKKKTALIAGIGAPVLVLGVWWYRQRKASQAGAPASASAAGGVTDPAGNTCAALDPSTGYCPGTQADLSGQSIGAVNAGNAGEGLNGYYYGGGGVPGSMPGPGNFADNAEWVQYVIAYEESNGLNPNVAAVTVSLGLYVAGSPVTSSQQADIETAIAIAGQPPIPGANGFPPGINLQTTGSGTGTSPGSCASGYTLSPTQTGHSGEIAATGGAGWCEPVSTGTGGGGTGGGGGGGAAQATVSGGHVIHVNNNEAVVGWTGHNAARYKSYIQGPGYPPKIPSTSGTTPEATFKGLKAGHNYVVTVIPINSAGQQGETGTISVVTTR